MARSIPRLKLHSGPKQIGATEIPYFNLLTIGRIIEKLGGLTCSSGFLDMVMSMSCGWLGDTPNYSHCLILPLNKIIKNFVFVMKKCFCRNFILQKSITIGVPNSQLLRKRFT